MYYYNAILNELINEFERKRTAEKISVDVQKKFPEYSDRFDYDTICDIEQAIDALIGGGYLTEAKKKDGFYRKIFLNTGKCGEIYDKLNRQPLSDMQNELKEILSEYLSAADSDDIVGRFCSEQFRRLGENKSLEYKIGSDREKLKNILTALKAICRLEQETYIRNFSEAVFHDSKKFSKIAGTVSTILKNYSSEPIENENVLEWFNLFQNPVYIYIKGDCKIYCKNGVLDIGAVEGGIALSPCSIDDIERISVSSEALISVENLTTYHDTSCENAVVIYLGGFHNSARTKLIKLIYRDGPNLNYYHKGDLDIFGFLILENLIGKTGVDFKPYEMDIVLLKECHEKGFYKSLDKIDREKAALPVLAKYSDVINYMLENDCKAEQESIEAMKLGIY